MKKYFYAICIITTAAFSTLITSCKKHSNDTPSIDLIRDSVYMYAKEDYLWYDALPSADVFNPRGFTGSSDLAALQSEVDALSQYKINTVTGKPYEYNVSYPGESKYSFIDNGQASQSVNGNSGDFGFYPVYSSISNTDLRVRYVNPGSPAALAGMRRGDLITAITNVAGLDKTSTANVNSITSALSQSKITMTLQRSNGTATPVTYTVNLSVTSYTTNPVIKDTVYSTSAGKKVGYLVFSQFTELTNAQSKLDAAFDYLIGQGITDLVVDLRYNGGGAVETAEYLDNLIVPAAKSGTKMYTAFYNDKLQAGNYPLLNAKYSIEVGAFTQAKTTVSFSKKKTLNISKVIFLVTSRTASASELTINNLLPHLDVKLIGTTTYGKPVGFFKIPVGSYQLYLSEFETKNSANQGGYYSGMTPGSGYDGYYASDDVTKDFGDPTENLLARSLSYINVGTYALPAQQVQSVGGGVSALAVQQTDDANSRLNNNSFTGMIYTNKLIRK